MIGIIRNYLVSNGQTISHKVFSEYLLALEIKKDILMNKPVYLDLAIQEIYNKVISVCFCMTMWNINEKSFRFTILALKYP